MDHSPDPETSVADDAPATMLLARTEFSGIVVIGDQRGRTLGFPTANLSLEGEDGVPDDGVYAGWVDLHDGTRCAAAVNIGVRPTLYSNGIRLLEAHLLDFAGDLYGTRIDVTLLTRLRSEQRFDSLVALTEQLRLDVERTREHTTR